MSSEGVRKAAMLLMSLDPATAAELLRSASQETVTEIAAEVAYLGQDAASNAAAFNEPVREFFDLLSEQGDKHEEEDFAGQMVRMIFSEQESQEVLSNVSRRVLQRDPFRQIRSAEAAAIAGALSGESPQAMAVVMSELPAKTSTELLQFLDEEARPLVVQCMAVAQGVSAEAKARLADIVQTRLERAASDDTAAQQIAPTGAAPVGINRQHRKVALLLRSLELEQREKLIKSLLESDAESAKGVQDMMMLWEDVLQVEGVCLQEALRSVDSRKLAAALVDAGEEIVNRVHENISERAKIMLEEEVSLLSDPKPDDIEQARETILVALRTLNAKGELLFIEG